MGRMRADSKKSQRLSKFVDVIFLLILYLHTCNIVHMYVQIVPHLRHFEGPSLAVLAVQSVCGEWHLLVEQTIAIFTKHDLVSQLEQCERISAYLHGHGECIASGIHQMTTARQVADKFRVIQLYVALS